MSENSPRAVFAAASAIAIRQQGWHVEVVEQSPRFTEIGAGLSLFPNALRALDALGVGEQVRDQAQRDRAAGIRTSRGTWLSRTDTATLERRFGPVVMIHRAVLLASGPEIGAEAIMTPEGDVIAPAASDPANRAVEATEAVTRALVGRTVADVERNLILDTLRQMDEEKNEEE